MIDQASLTPICAPLHQHHTKMFAVMKIPQLIKLYKFLWYLKDVFDDDYDHHHSLAIGIW